MSSWKLVPDRAGYAEVPLFRGQPVTIGRKDCTVNVPCKRVSSKHLTLVLEQAYPLRMLLCDESANGVYVNGRRVTPNATGRKCLELKSGDVICLINSDNKGVSADLRDDVPCFAFMPAGLSGSSIAHGAEAEGESAASQEFDLPCETNRATTSAGADQASASLSCGSGAGLEPRRQVIDLDEQEGDASRSGERAATSAPSAHETAAYEEGTPELGLPEEGQPSAAAAPLYARARGQPMCKYGKSCYRTQPEHFTQFDHPSSHAKLRRQSTRDAVDLTAASPSGAANPIVLSDSSFSEFRHRPGDNAGASSGWRPRPRDVPAPNGGTGAGRRGQSRAARAGSRTAAPRGGGKASRKQGGSGSEDDSWSESESEEEEEDEDESDASSADGKRRRPARGRAKRAPKRPNRNDSESEEEAETSAEESDSGDGASRRPKKQPKPSQHKAVQRGGPRAGASSKETLQKLAREEGRRPAGGGGNQGGAGSGMGERRRQIMMSDDDDVTVEQEEKPESEVEDVDQEASDPSDGDDDDDEASTGPRPVSDMKTALAQALRDCERYNEQIQKRLLCVHAGADEPCLTATAFAVGGGEPLAHPEGSAAPGKPDSLLQQPEGQHTRLPDGLLQQPASLGSESRSLSGYQLVGLNWLWVMHELGLGGILADEMGLGKTVQVIALLAALKEAGKPGPHLVVAPASVLGNWHREVVTWCPSLRVAKYHGAKSARHAMQLELDSRGFDVVLTTYTYFEGEGEANLIDRKWLYSKKWGCCVLDEAHALKRADSARYIRLSRLRSAQRVLLTGTPVQNNTRELLTLLSFMLPATFPPGLASAFAARAAGAEDAAEVRRARRLLAPFVLRRSKRDVLQQLAPKAEEEAVVAMTPGQRALYASLLERGRSLVAGRERRGTGRNAKPPSAAENKAAKSLFFDLRKAACHPCLMRSHYTAADVEEMAKAAKAMEFFGANATLSMIQKELATNSDFQLHQLCLELPQVHRLALPHHVLCESGKVARLVALLPRLREEGHKVLIFSQWTQMLDIMESILGAPPGLDLSFVRLDGSTAVEERQQLIDSFQAKDSQIFAFLLSTRAGGQGITLTAADTVIIHDLDWNPQLDRQAVDRAHRIGQTRPVRVIRMVTAETVEEQIHSMQQRKAGLDAQLLGDVRKSPHKRGGDAAPDDDDGFVDLDVRMMTTMIHKALAAPFLTSAFAPADAPAASTGPAKGTHGAGGQEGAALP